MNANTASRAHLASVVDTYSNRLLLDLYRDGEGNDADILRAEIDNRGGLIAVEMAKYAPIAKPHSDDCRTLDGDDCCGNYAYGIDHLYIDL